MKLFRKFLLYVWLPVATLSLLWQVLILVLTPQPDLGALVWKQTDDKLYNGEGPYMVRVMADHFSFNPFLLEFVPSWQIAVTRVQNPDYGHFAVVDFDDWYIDGVAGIKRTKVTFTADGVRLIQPRGKTLFIPAKYFLGGR